MATRFVRGKARTETPRLKDLTVRATERDRSVGRDESGRFVHGNRHANGRGWKATIRRMLGSAAGDDDAADVVRQATRLYVAILQSLPSDGPGVRQLVAAQARHAALAAYYANAAARVGLSTDGGLRFAEASRSHDGSAQRLATTAFDMARHEARERAANAPPVDLSKLFGGP